MAIETLDDALSAAWRLHVRCIGGQVDYVSSSANCKYQAELDLETLVWTRGRNMALAGLNQRIVCPHCGNRRVHLFFEPPRGRGTDAEVGMQSKARDGEASSAQLRDPPL